MTAAEGATCDLDDCPGFPNDTETTKCMYSQCIVLIHSACTEIFGPGDDELFCSWRCVVDHATSRGVDVKGASQFLHRSCWEAYDNFVSMYISTGDSDDEKQDLSYIFEGQEDERDEDLGGRQRNVEKSKDREQDEQDEDHSEDGKREEENEDNDSGLRQEITEETNDNDDDLTKFIAKKPKPPRVPTIKTSQREAPQKTRKASAITMKRGELLNRKCLLDIGGGMSKFLVTAVSKQKVQDGVTTRGIPKFRTQFYVELQGLQGAKDVLKNVPEERIAMSLLPPHSTQLGGAVMPPDAEVLKAPPKQKLRVAVSAALQELALPQPSPQASPERVPLRAEPSLPSSSRVPLSMSIGVSPSRVPVRGKFKPVAKQQIVLEAPGSPQTSPLGSLIG